MRIGVKQQLGLEAKALLAQTLKICGGEHEDWDKWAKEWLAGDRTDVRGMVRETRGFTAGVMAALGITWHDHMDAAFGESGVKPLALAPRHARARAREDVTMAIARSFAMRSDPTRAIGLLGYASGNAQVGG